MMHGQQNIKFEEFSVILRVYCENMKHATGIIDAASISHEVGLREV
jgi:hypothetical protein